MMSKEKEKNHADKYSEWYHTQMKIIAHNAEVKIFYYGLATKTYGRAIQPINKVKCPSCKSWIIADFKWNCSMCGSKIGMTLDE